MCSFEACCVQVTTTVAALIQQRPTVLFPFLRTDDASPPPTAQLTRGSLARVVGATSTLLRLAASGPRNRLCRPDRSGACSEAVAATTAAAGTILRDRPLANAPAILTFDQATTADVLGDFNGFNYVRTNASGYGWVAS